MDGLKGDISGSVQVASSVKIPLLFQAGPNSLYESGIRESFVYLGIPTSALPEYLNQELVKYETASNKIQRIIEQKWLQ